MKNLFPILGVLSALIFSCNSPSSQISREEYAKLSDLQKRSADFALAGIEVPDERLELTLFASEPMMSNPTNMDIDDRGRVWITEAYNYRNQLNPRNPIKDEGDRILIMEDSNGDGKADFSKVFYQGSDINAALGIAVLGNKVFVSVSPNVFVFTDENGDDIPDKKEILFTGVGGVQHDHGMHAFTFGPDGKLYFNYGNEGKGLHKADGSPILDPMGRPVNSETWPYQEGMVFRSDPDGSNPEILAWNFRNNYELAVDSYGRMWQSDNDDDGNRSTRINYVMDYGNYGFKDEMTKADWRTRRINLEDSVFYQHWHLNDPGVVPNLLQTYAGSPTGIVIYEGTLLPEEYQNQIIHADAGPNIVRAYPVEKSGAGFSGKIVNMIDGNNRDQWFRPSDVTVAPDGSLFVSDWYDPGVGGHAVGDLDKGRIYRLAPKGHPFQVSPADYSSPESLIELLQNPNRAIHFKAFMALVEMGEKALPALEKLYSSSNSRMKARAFWVLTKMENGNEFILKAADDEDENIRVAAIRASRINKLNDQEFLLKMAEDPSSQVRREVAFAIRYQAQPEVWVKLAESYPEGDRWYLEALGIGAEGQWDSYLDTYLKSKENWMDSPEARDIVWRSRSRQSAELLKQLIQANSGNDRLRYYRALDFQEASAKNKALKSLLDNSGEVDEVIILRQLTYNSTQPDQAILTLAKAKVGEIQNDEDFLEILNKYKLTEQKERLLKFIFQGKERKTANSAANIFSELYGLKEIEKYFNQETQEKSIEALDKFGIVDSEKMAKSLTEIFKDSSRPLEIRRAAMKAMKGWNSEAYLWTLSQKDEIPEDVMSEARAILLSTWHSDIRKAANEKFGTGATTGYDMRHVLSASGNLEKGKAIAAAYCLSCHKMGDQGTDFGPGLTLIGDKLSREGLINAIINPNEGMGFGYETQLVKFKDGKEVRCIVNSRTENDLIVKLIGSGDQTIYKLADIESVTKLNESLMPSFPLPENELIDLVSYLETLRK